MSGFTPDTSYQQAGLIVYNDDDNYLKFGYEYNWPNAGGQAFCILTETDANSNFQYLDTEHSGLKRYWVRLTKRGNRYEYAFSSDGKSFTVNGEVEWGDGSPKQIGILAKNGGNKDAGELDAAFEFFELRARRRLHPSQSAPAQSRENAGLVLSSQPFSKAGEAMVRMKSLVRDRVRVVRISDHGRLDRVVSASRKTQAAGRYPGGSQGIGIVARHLFPRNVRVRFLSRRRKATEAGHATRAGAALPGHPR